ncbi:hypothetical protein HNP40_002876 [Mycobacteroides chelonae]|nr:hypothetical protein [Mycobacteroides chelonae]
MSRRPLALGPLTVLAALVAGIVAAPGWGGVLWRCVGRSSQE